MNNYFLKDLNQEQQKAVLQTEGPIIILAGAGSGKTRVLTYKVMYLITENYVNPKNILIVSLTYIAGNGTSSHNSLITIGMLLSL